MLRFLPNSTIACCEFFWGRRPDTFAGTGRIIERLARHHPMVHKLRFACNRTARRRVRGRTWFIAMSITDRHLCSIIPTQQRRGDLVRHSHRLTWQLINQMNSSTSPPIQKAEERSSQTRPICPILPNSNFLSAHDIAYQFRFSHNSCNLSTEKKRFS